jgi:putative transposase
MALQHNAPANDAISYAGYRFPPDVISYALRLWLCHVVGMVA